MSLTTAVVDEVRRRARAAGLSQNALARAAGMPATQVHRSMSGERDLSLAEVEALARALGTSAVWLIRTAMQHPRSGDTTRAASESTQV